MVTMVAPSLWAPAGSAGQGRTNRRWNRGPSQGLRPQASSWPRTIPGHCERREDQAGVGGVDRPGTPDGAGDVVAVHDELAQQDGALRGELDGHPAEEGDWVGGG